MPTTPTDKVISADDHIDLCWLPRDLWTSRAPESLQERVPAVRDSAQGPVWSCQGETWGAWGRPHSANRRSALADDDAAEGIFRPTTASLRLTDMDRDGVEATVMYGPIVPMLVSDPEVRRACYQGYNDWLLEFCAASPARLIGAALLPSDDPATALSEFQRVAAQGIRHVMLLAAAASTPIYDDSWKAFWDFAEECQVPVGLHANLTSRSQAKPVAALESAAVAIRNVHAPMQLLDSFTGLVFSGVLQSRPGLRIVLAETSIGWIPFVMDRMDKTYLQLAENSEFWSSRGGLGLNTLPSEICKQQVWITFQEDRVGLALIPQLGEDRLMWASDYPHPDSTWPNSQETIQEQMAHLTPPTRRKIVYQNAKQLYKI